MFFYEGKEGEVKGSVGQEGASSLMACSWSPDSTRIATAGANGVVEIWDAATMKSAQTYSVGSDVLSQQNGVVYANANLVVSVSLSGVLNLFDTRESSSSKWRTLHGPTKAITASTLGSSEKDKTFYAGSFDGAIRGFSVSGGESDGTCEPVSGTGHSARVAAMATDGQKVWSAGWDDKISTIESGSFASSSTPTKSQPTGVAATANAVYVASSSGLEIHPTSGSASVHPGPVTAVGAYAGPNGDFVAYGAGGKKLVLASVSGGAVKVEKEYEENKAEVLSVAFSEDGSLLAAGDVSSPPLIRRQLTDSRAAGSSSSTPTRKKSRSVASGRSILPASPPWSFRRTANGSSLPPLMRPYTSGKWTNL